MEEKQLRAPNHKQSHVPIHVLQVFHASVSSVSHTFVTCLAHVNDDAPQHYIMPKLLGLRKIPVIIRNTFNKRTLSTSRSPGFRLSQSSLRVRSATTPSWDHRSTGQL